MTGPWFLAPPIWISDLALLLMVVGLAWLAHEVAWRLAGDHGWYRLRRYRAPTRLAVIAIAVLAMPAVVETLGRSMLPWAHLGLLGLIAAGGWLALAALDTGRAAGGGRFALVAIGLAVLALALVTFPAVTGISTVLLACAAAMALVLAVAIGRHIG